MVRTIFTSAFKLKKSPLELELKITNQEGLDFVYKFNCDESEIKTQIQKYISQIPNIKDSQILRMNLKGRDVKSYDLSHIELRYHIARTFHYHDFLEIMYKTEVDISVIYSNFKKSLKPPFDKMLDN